ncbi:MAG: hypothetical protein WC729_26415 [Sphingomonas sp.]|jgi:hypothetical protein|uniref:hypothetical protein n=1 Tax=Sphingomonas sp. TaxID=28214 RepID=UPI00356491F9
MDEPSLRKSRLAVAGGLAAVLLVGGSGFLVGRGTSSRDPVPVEATPVIAPALAYVPPPVQPNPRSQVMTRRDLIALASQAADAAASGRHAPAAVGDAGGRRFEVRIPFGCQGPSDTLSKAAMRWRYDPEAKALRVHVDPVVWNKMDFLPLELPATVEAIEGFWIAHPWTSSESCPPAGDGPAGSSSEPVTLPGQTLALAQFFGTDGARQGRRDDRPYDTVVRMAPDELHGEQGFRLKIRGRIANIPGSGPVSCRQPAGAEQRPICVVGIVTDEIAIENPATSTVLATWTVEARGPASQ